MFCGEDCGDTMDLLLVYSRDFKYQFSYILIEETSFHDAPFHTMDHFLDNMGTIYLYVILAFITAVRKGLTLFNATLLLNPVDDQSDSPMVDLISFFIGSSVLFGICYDPSFVSVQPSFASDAVNSWIIYLLVPSAIAELLSMLYLMAGLGAAQQPIVTDTEQIKHKRDDDYQERQEETLEDMDYEVRLLRAVKVLFFSSFRSFLFLMAQLMDCMRISQNSLLMILFLQNIQARSSMIIYFATEAFLFALSPTAMSSHSDSLATHLFCGPERKLIATKYGWRTVICKWIHCVFYFVAVLSISSPQIYDKQEEIIRLEDSKSFMIFISWMGVARLVERIPYQISNNHQQQNEQYFDLQYVFGTVIPIIGQTLFYIIMAVFWKAFNYGSDMDAGLFHFKFALDTSLVLTVVSTLLVTLCGGSSGII